MKFVWALVSLVIGLFALIDMMRPGTQFFSAIVCGFCSVTVWRAVWHADR